MTRATKWMMTLAVLAGGLMTQQVMAQQVVQPAAPAQVRTVQPSRSYRSYSVNPARGDVRRNGPAWPPGGMRVPRPPGTTPAVAEQEDFNAKS